MLTQFVVAGCSFSNGSSTIGPAQPPETWSQ